MVLGVLVYLTSNWLRKFMSFFLGTSIFALAKEIFKAWIDPTEYNPSEIYGILTGISFVILPIIYSWLREKKKTWKKR